MSGSGESETRETAPRQDGAQPASRSLPGCPLPRRQKQHLEGVISGVKTTGPRRCTSSRSYTGESANWSPDLGWPGGREFLWVHMWFAPVPPLLCSELESWNLLACLAGVGRAKAWGVNVVCGLCQGGSCGQEGTAVLCMDTPEKRKAPCGAWELRNRGHLALPPSRERAGATGPPPWSRKNLPGASQYQPVSAL